MQQTPWIGGVALFVILGACSDPAARSPDSAGIGVDSAVTVDASNTMDGSMTMDGATTQMDALMTARDGQASVDARDEPPQLDANVVSPEGWRLVWADEFDGTAIDGTKWQHEINCWGGGNNELQCYVDAAKNSFVRDGALHLVAIADNPSGAVGGPGNDQNVVSRPYSSARLNSRGRGDFRYGRIEARLTLPRGQGLWPAFWMLPTDSVYGGWAASGEIDIMEAVNSGPGNNLVYGTLHYGGQWPANVNTGDSFTPVGNVWEVAHVYAVEWQEGEIRWFVDDQHTQTQTAWNTTAGTFPAPFDQAFHMLLNVAVGGQWPGPPNNATTFPQEMIVDYVRVYECASNPTTGIGCGTSN